MVYHIPIVHDLVVHDFVVDLVVDCYSQNQCQIVFSLSAAHIQMFQLVQESDQMMLYNEQERNNYYTVNSIVITVIVHYSYRQEYQLQL